MLSDLAAAFRKHAAIITDPSTVHAQWLGRRSRETRSSSPRGGYRLACLAMHCDIVLLHQIEVDLFDLWRPSKLELLISWTLKCEAAMKEGAV